MNIYINKKSIIPRCENYDIIRKQLNKNFYSNFNNKNILKPKPIRIIPKCSNEDYDRIRQKLNKHFYYVKKPISLDETNMILKPLFKNITLEIEVVTLKMYVNIVNKKNNDLQNQLILDVINELEVHDDFRRFIIKAMSTSNKKNIYKLDDGMMWKCPLNMNYVFGDDITI